MKTKTHPTYHQITVSCACGSSFQTGSTKEGDLRVEICAQCHPLYTGKSKLVDSAGRVDKFQARQKLAESRQAEAIARAAKRAEASTEDESNA